MIKVKEKNVCIYKREHDRSGIPTVILPNLSLSILNKIIRLQAFETPDVL